MRLLLLWCLIVPQVICYSHHEDDEARVLSEVWEAMDKHRGDDIVLIPRSHDGPERHDDSDHRSSGHHGPYSGHHGPSSDHHGPSSGERSESEQKPNETESTSESPSSSSSSPSESSEHSSDESSRGHHGRSYDSGPDQGPVWDRFNRMSDMMDRAVERLRKDDRDIRELEEEASSGGATVFILEIVGAVVVGLILVGLLIFGFAKGLKGFKTWKARRQSERLVDQEAPNMDGTGYQSGYNP